MNATQLEFAEKVQGRTQTEQLRALFLARPGQWLGMTELGAAIGAWAVHSRVADCRRRFAMTIENRSELQDGKRHSFYRYLPD